MKVMRNALTIVGTISMLAATPALAQTGVASWYQMGHTTASGERYNPDGLTAAHPSLPFGTIVQVENLNNGRTVSLRINDRGPFTGGRIIDVSRGGARQLGLMSSGTARVRVTTVAGGGSARTFAGSGGGGGSFARQGGGVKVASDQGSSDLACEAFKNCF